MLMRKTAIALFSSCSEDPYSTEEHLFYNNVAHTACTHVHPLLTACNVYSVGINC